MNDLERQTNRVLIIAQDWQERALIAAQLQQEISCRVVSAASLEDGLGHLVMRTALIIVDWSNLEDAFELWPKFRAAARGVPILILASKIDRDELAKLGIESTSILFRPFTVGDVIYRALTALKEAWSHDGTDGREQAAN